MARVGIEQCPDRPSEVESETSKSWEYVLCPLDVVMSYHARAKRFANSVPKDRSLQVLPEIDEAEGLMRTERVRSQNVGAAIQAAFQKRAHVWVWHDRPNGFTGEASDVNDGDNKQILRDTKGYLDQGDKDKEGQAEDPASLCREF